MPKADIEFTHISTLTPAPLTPSDPTKSGNATIRVLSHDSRTGDQTSVLHHPPGSSWGEQACLNEYWEEAYILEGRIYDETLQKWFGKGSFCCRPPWMKHGPYKADPETGCEEICYWKYPKKTEKGSKILPKTMRKSSGISAASTPVQMEAMALETQTTTEEAQDAVQSVQPGQGNVTSPRSPKTGSRLAAYLADGDRRPNIQHSGANPLERPRQIAQTVEQPEGVNTAPPSSPNPQSRLAAYIASEEKRPQSEANHSAPVVDARQNDKSKGGQTPAPLTPKRQSRLATYLASEDKRVKAEENGSAPLSQPSTPPSPSNGATPPRQSRLAAYRSGGWNS